MSYQLKNTAAVILAAGRGKRMGANHKNKVAYQLNGRPMIAHTVDNLHTAGLGQIIVVVGYQADSVKKALGSSVEYVVQKEQLGTGDALKTALSALKPGITTVLSVYGDDSAFYPPALYQELAAEQALTQADILVLTIHKDNPADLGRIVRDQEGRLVKIVEEKNANEEEKQIKEINTGFYCFNRQFLDTHINLIKLDPVKAEYLATDLVEIALSAGKKVTAHFVPDEGIWHGVNTKADYLEARNKYQRISHA